MGLRRNVVADAIIPNRPDWQKFLHVDANKTQLYRFLTETVLQWFNLSDKQLVNTDGEKVYSKPPLPDISSLFPCNHKEAEGRMLLHASHAAHQGHNHIMIRTVDTDVVVLAVSVSQQLQDEEIEMWNAFGVVHMKYPPDWD